MGHLVLILPPFRLIVYLVALFILIYFLFRVDNDLRWNFIGFMNGFAYVLCVHAEFMILRFQDERGSMAESWFYENENI